MNRLPIRSFDIFDTLVARRCVRPNEIFVLVERASGLKGFAAMRSQAERILYERGEYTLDDIYRTLAHNFELKGEDARRLKEIELETEYDNLIPIQRHIADVRPDDIIVSDMYLPRDFILRVLKKKCGLHFNALCLSSHGKRSGRAWNTLRSLVQLEEHTGDDHYSDVVTPKQYGIKTTHTTISRMTPHELKVEALGYPSLARVMRENRLLTWSPDPTKAHLGIAQAQFNFPLLYVVALLLIHFASSRDLTTLLFSSRDCFFLFNLFQRISSRFGCDIKSEYFFTSRLARSAPSASYLKYFQSLCGVEKVAVIDMAGTGYSLTRLIEAAKRPDVSLILVNHNIDDTDLLKRYRQIADLDHDPVVHSFTTLSGTVVLEALNTALHTMVADVIGSESLFVPVFAELPTMERYYDLAMFSEQVFMRGLDLLDSIPADELSRNLSTVQKSHVDELYREFTQLLSVASEIVKQQVSENQYLEPLLRQRMSNARAGTPPPNDLRRNSLCPCGSGEKFKKCCGSYITLTGPR